jgi:signal transduction histidine kinase
MVTLASSKPFRLLAPGEQQALERIARRQTFAAGSEIFREGDPGDGVYVVADGLVEISTRTANDQRRVFAEVEPGEMFGEMAVIEVKPRSATATAARESVVYFIARDELLQMIERSPALAMEMLREISQRLRDFNQKFVQELIQAERLAVVGRFARSIVHDVKNPLNIISLTAELSCMEMATDETRKRASVTIRKQIDRITEMINEILDFTQGARTPTVMATLDYGEFTRQLLEELRPELELKNSSLELMEVPSVKLPLDPRRLRRVFYNLLHNATDAMPDGGRIHVRFINGGGELVTEIEDSGSGIAPEIADTLFDAFTTHGKAHGTGLGLSICKKIVEDHRGRIWTRTEPGRGAIFCFALPLPRK